MISTLPSVGSVGAEVVASGYCSTCMLQSHSQSKKIRLDRV